MLSFGFCKFSVPRCMGHTLPFVCCIIIPSRVRHMHVHVSKCSLMITKRFVLNYQITNKNYHHVGIHWFSLLCLLFLLVSCWSMIFRAVTRSWRCDRLHFKRRSMANVELKMFQHGPTYQLFIFHIFRSTSIISSVHFPT